MKGDAQILQRSLLVVGVLFALCTFFSFGSVQSTSWLVAASALCFVALACTVFFSPKSAWTSGLIGGGVVLLTYAFHMPFWGRLWYGDDGPEDWKILCLFVVIGLNFLLPAIRGFKVTKQHEKSPSTGDGR
jgi:hypothetical protein